MRDAAERGWIDYDEPVEPLDEVTELVPALLRGEARLLAHVDPGVEPGETVAVGEPLGELVRSGSSRRR